LNPDRWEHLKRIFHAASEVEPASRAEFLREACAGDEPLREEIEALLARHADSTDFLESPALVLEARALAEDLAWEASTGRGHSPVAIPTGTASPRPVRSTRPPLWMYALAAVFLFDSLLRAYCIVLGPDVFGLRTTWEGGRFAVRTVTAESVADRGGFKPGDVLLSMDGQALRHRSDWRVINPNLVTGRPYHFDVDREGRRVHLVCTIERVGIRDRWIIVLWEVNGFLLLATAFLIGFSRPRDALPRLGALALGTLSISLSYWAHFPPGGAAIWRNLPSILGGLLWVPTLCTYLVGPILLTFFSLFPRALFRARWPLAVIWLPPLCLVPVYAHDAFLILHRPAQAYGNLLWDATPLVGGRLYGLYGLLSLAALTVNYFRLEDLNDRRRLRVLFVGGAAAVLPGAFRLLVWQSASFPRLWNWLSAGAAVNIALVAIFVLFPASFAYSILRHRLLDIRLIIRQGLQYAAARGALLSAVPILGILLVADLLAHGDQPLIRILEARGWVYAALAAVAVAAHSQRRRWGDAIDRRFFREHYDARRLLREVAAESGRARSLAEAAPGVVIRVQAALHPEFAAILHRPATAASFRSLASSPSDKAPPPIPAESTLISTLRSLDEPLGVALGESGRLLMRLPEPEIAFVRTVRMDLIVPIALAPAPREALLVLGIKRSEEPYTNDDREMLAAVASNLELLLERPEVPPARPKEEFEECPVCGNCYDTGAGHCPRDGSDLATVHLTRILADRYRLERRRGSGGMGAVYEATDSALARRVALKVIREDRLGNPGAPERFQREARAAAAFPHPNVVTVHDYGIDAGTRAFLVMELLEGATLREELRARQRLDPVRVAGIFRGLCSAVEAAHLRQLIHRDLKPENVFLVRTGDATSETVKVLDFGIAKFLPGFEEGGDTLNLGETNAGILVGTPSYMSPEQLLGEEPAVSWDLWALAVTAFEALTGVLPFPAASREQWRRAVLAGRYTRLGALLPDPPIAWDEFFARALAADRARRPASAAEFLRDLEEALIPTTTNSPRSARA